MVYCGRDYHRDWFIAHPGYHYTKKKQYRYRNKEVVSKFAHRTGCEICGVKNDEMFFIIPGLGVSNSLIRYRCDRTPAVKTIELELSCMKVYCKSCVTTVAPPGFQKGF